MKKPYEGHEITYRRMRREGILVWGQKGKGTNVKSCRAETNNFLKDALSQPWAPKGGRAIEFGCGTGPILRWVCKRGFSGLGIDISRTAIAMAKEQSKEVDIRFRRADVCNLNAKSFGEFDLVIDGFCLHCITLPKERKAFLNNAFRMLKRGGLFVLNTMCGPMDRKGFYEACKDYKIVKKVIYVPFEDKSYERLSRFNGKYYLPTRYVGHWKDILSEVRKAGFELKLIRYNANNHKDFCGTLTVGALK